MASHGYPSAPPAFHGSPPSGQQHGYPYPVANAYPVANVYGAPPPALNPHFQQHHRPSPNHGQNFVPLEDEPQTAHLYVGPQSHGQDMYMQPAQGMPVIHQGGNRIKQFIARPFQQMPFVQTLNTNHGVPAHHGGPVVVQVPMPEEKRTLMWQFRVAILILMLMYRGIDFFVQKSRVDNRGDDDDHGLASFFYGMFGLFAPPCVGLLIMGTYFLPWFAVLQGLAVVVLFATQSFFILYMVVFFYLSALALQLTHIICARWIEGRWKFWPLVRPHWGAVWIDVFLGPVTLYWCGSVISQDHMGALWGYKLDRNDWGGQIIPLLFFAILFYLGILGSICFLHGAIGHWWRQRQTGRGQMTMV